MSIISSNILNAMDIPKTHQAMINHFSKEDPKMLGKGAVIDGEKL
jgi:hypothetical protein